jgi:hypothetical protein
MNDKQRIMLTRLVTGALLFLLLLRLTEYATLSGIASPPLFTANLDITYWLYLLSGLPTLIVHNRAGAIVFDGLLFGTGLLSFLFPLQRKWIIPFSILLFIYAISINAFSTDHLGQVWGYMIVLLPFWVADNNKCWFAWQAMRYYTCYAYVMAFVWKTLLKDSFYYSHQGVNAFKLNLFDYIYQNPDNPLTHLYKWFLRHEWILNGGEKFAILLEGVMVIGFFTRKYDRWLIWVPVTIHVLTYFFADVFFIELLVLDLSFLSLSQLDRLGSRTYRLAGLQNAKNGDKTPQKR